MVSLEFYRELLTVAHHRGDVLNDDYNCTMFHTYTPPNSKLPDQMGSYTFCSNLYLNNPPCNNLNPALINAPQRSDVEPRPPDFFLGRLFQLHLLLVERVAEGEPQ